MIARIYNSLLKLSLPKVFAVCFASIFLHQVVTGTLARILGIAFAREDPFKYADLSKVFLVTVLIAPIAETLLNQYLPIMLLDRYVQQGKLRRRWVVIITALAFGSLHYYSVLYVFYAAVIGIVLGAGYYVVFDKTRDHWISIWFIAANHACVNLDVFLLKRI